MVITSTANCYSSQLWRHMSCENGEHKSRPGLPGAIKTYPCLHIYNPYSVRRSPEQHHMKQQTYMFENGRLCRFDVDYHTTPKSNWSQMRQRNCTVTEALVLRSLLEDWRITESIRAGILVLVNKIKQKCFQITTKWHLNNYFLAVEHFTS